MNTSYPIRIALVDDHSLVRDGIRALLGVRPSFDVVGEAENGAQALDLCGRVSPDILLVDIGLKDMNGLELTRLLRIQYPDIKILILSMYDNHEYIATSIRAGASGYVLKNAPAGRFTAPKWPSNWPPGNQMKPSSRLGKAKCSSAWRRV